MAGPHTLDLPISRDAVGVGVPVKLVVVAGPNQGAEVPLVDRCVIGQDPDCHLVIDDPTVSRRHVLVAVTGSKIHVEDLGSSNGTFMGDARVHKAEAQLGSVLSIGKSAVAIQPRWHIREVPPSSSRRFRGLIGESVAMREVFAILERVAPTDCTVLVEGESGTGKELICRSIHEASPRKAAPYQVFDCGAVPAELAESELFGHRKGAFTGAVEHREGAFQRAHGGTLCLDEIGELPAALQTRLLRVLETGEVRRVGDDQMRVVDVRVLAATNRDLNAEVRAGRFREDLLFRLDVVRVRVPPLRQRPEEIPALVRHFMAGKLAADDPIEGENLNRLLAYSWPGNVRELRNALSRAHALARKPSDGPPKFADLVFNLGPATGPRTIGSAFPGVAAPMAFKEAKALVLESFEHAYVEALLSRHRGNISRAAQAAELSRKHLYDLIKRTVGASDSEDEQGE